MKKLFFFIATAAMLLSGCAKEKFQNGPKGDSVTVSFYAQMVNEATKAVIDNDGNGVNADQCKLQIWWKDVLYFEKVVPVTSYTAEFKDLVLIKDQTYDFLFWADNAAGAYYNTEDLHAVALTSTYVGCDDARDAFFKAETWTVSEAFSKTVELRRPFAQLNVITRDIPGIYDMLKTKSDLDKVTPEKVAVKVTAPSVFNVKTGEATTDIEFDYEAAVYTNPYKTDSGKENTLSMDYFYAPATDGNIVDVYFAAKNATSGLVDIEYNWSNIPLRRNYRTNIVGNLLTKTGSIQVIVVPEWDGEKTVEIWAPGMITPITPDAQGIYNVEEPSQLAWVAQEVNGGNTFDGKTIKLANDINLSDGLWTPIGNNANNFKGTFDGNGKTISNLFIAMGNTTEPAGLFGFLNNGTIKDFTIENAEVEAYTEGGVAAVVGKIFNTGTVEGVNVKVASLTANRRAGAIAGNSYGAIKDCSVEGVSIKLIPDVATRAAVYDNGDKAGAIVGFSALDNLNEISGNTAKDVVIEGYRDLGGIAGCAKADKVSNNTVNGLYIKADRNITYAEVKQANCNEIIGLTDGSTIGAGNACTGEKKIVIIENEAENKLFNAEKGDTVVIEENTSKITIPSTLAEEVTIKAAEDVVVDKIVIPAGAEVKDLTIKDFKPTLTGTGFGMDNSFVGISKDAKVENLVIDGCTFTGPGTKDKNAIFIEPDAAAKAKTIEIKNCTCTGMRYFVYSSGQLPGTTIKVSNCNISNMASWAIMVNNGNVAGLDIQNCTFGATNTTYTQGDIVKVLDTNKYTDFVFVFKNNTITSAQANFSVKAKPSKTEISGNTKGGEAWNPTIGTLSEE